MIVFHTAENKREQPTITTTDSSNNNQGKLPHAFSLVLFSVFIVFPPSIFVVRKVNILQFFHRISFDFFFGAEDCIRSVQAKFKNSVHPNAIWMKKKEQN